MITMISWLWINRGLSGSLLLAALVAAAAVYVMSLRSDNAALIADLVAAEGPPVPRRRSPGRSGSRRRLRR